VILFRLNNARAPRVIDRLATVLASCSDARTRGAIVIVEETTGPRLVDRLEAAAPDAENASSARADWLN
jgi:hypothetical protein